MFESYVRESDFVVMPYRYREYHVLYIFCEGIFNYLILESIFFDYRNQQQEKMIPLLSNILSLKIYDVNTLIIFPSIIKSYKLLIIFF